MNLASYLPDLADVPESLYDEAISDSFRSWVRSRGIAPFLPKKKQSSEQKPVIMSSSQHPPVLENRLSPYMRISSPSRITGEHSIQHQLKRWSMKNSLPCATPLARKMSG